LLIVFRIVASPTDRSRMTILPAARCA